MSSQFVVMIGAFPPPMGGAAKNNQIMYETLVHAGVAVTKFDTAVKGHRLHHRSLGFHAQRILSNTRAIFGTLKRANRLGTLYVVPDGGLGIYYTLAQLRLVGTRFGRVVLHHRTFRYVDGYSAAMASIVTINPSRTTHVFLSNGMREKFQALYGSVDGRVASNARFVESEARKDAPARAPGRLRIGHLSNLCREKGFFEVADAFDAIRAAGVDAELILAGPILEQEVAERLTSLSAKHAGSIRHLGAVSGDAKNAFYSRLDLFLFPTLFDQEAAPNVVYEALAAGVPVVATPRGCISEMLDGIPACKCVAIEHFGEAAVRSATDLSRTREASPHAAPIKSHIRTQCTESAQQYSELLALLGAEYDAVIND